jgi:ribosome maturation factor RimP
MDRELLKEADFARFAGKAVTLSLYKAHAGAGTLHGILEGAEDGDIVIRDEGGTSVRLPRAQVAKVRLNPWAGEI